MKFKHIISILLNILYPPKCIFCRRGLSIKSNYLFCDECRDSLDFLKDKVCCTRCGKPLVSFGDKLLCYNCINETHFYYKRIVSVFEYDGAPKASLLRYKSNPKRLYANIYADLMYERFLECYSGESIDFIVTVPSDKKRTLKRGADHVGLLCEELSKRTNIPFYRDCFKKVRKTVKQSTLSYIDRQTNLNDSVRVINPDTVKDKVCLLVDDVCTTGATIRECSKELKFSGCKKILALTLCTTSKKPKKRKV